MERRERLARWRAANPEKAREQVRRAMAKPEFYEQKRQYRAEVRAKVFAHYGEICACCDSTENLSIDHVGGGGGGHRRTEFGPHNVGSYRFDLWLIREGFPEDYQVLCVPCNQSKGEGAQCRLWHGDPSFKRCSHCGDVKPLEDFHRNRNNRTGRASWCAACMSEHRKAGTR